MRARSASSRSNVKEIAVPDEALYGRYLAEDIVDMDTGVIYAEAGEELDAKRLDKLRERASKSCPFSTSTISIPARSSATR